MDYSTQELIEKYKSEMQKMISNVKTLNERADNKINSSAEISAPHTAPQAAPTPMEQTSAQTPQNEAQTQQQFPRFNADSDGLRLRIEEILRQNSDVATSDDYPSAVAGAQVSKQPQMAPQTQIAPQMQSPTEIAQQAQNTPQNLPSDPAFETPPPTLPIDLGQTPSPINEAAPEPQIPSQNAGQQIQSQITEQTGLSESQQEVVSRTCIRGGAKAQYSPPANTGSSRLPTESENPALSGVGRLRVETFAANRAYPISNAVIRIKNPDDNSLVAVLVTNEDGLTESIDLPAPSGTLSQTPEFPDPFFNYNVDIRAEGYTPRENLNAQMFGGIDSLISANLVPEEPFGRSGENG